MQNEWHRIIIRMCGLLYLHSSVDSKLNELLYLSVMNLIFVRHSIIVHTSFACTLHTKHITNAWIRRRHCQLNYSYVPKWGMGRHPPGYSIYLILQRIGSDVNLNAISFHFSVMSKCVCLWLCTYLIFLSFRLLITIAFSMNVSRHSPPSTYICSTFTIVLFLPKIPHALNWTLTGHSLRRRRRPETDSIFNVQTVPQMQMSMILVWFFSISIFFFLSWQKVEALLRIKRNRLSDWRKNWNAYVSKSTYFILMSFEQRKVERKGYSHSFVQNQQNHASLVWSGLVRWHK